MEQNAEQFLFSVLKEIASTAAQGCAYHVISNVDESGHYQSGWTLEFTHKMISEAWHDKKKRVPGKHGTDV